MHKKPTHMQIKDETGRKTTNLDNFLMVHDSFCIKI